MVAHHLLQFFRFFIRQWTIESLCLYLPEAAITSSTSQKFHPHFFSEGGGIEESRKAHLSDRLHPRARDIALSDRHYGGFLLQQRLNDALPADQGDMGARA